MLLGRAVILIHLFTLFCRYAGHVWIRNYPPIQELHDVERTANDAIIFTQAVGFGNRNVCFL